MSGPAGAPAPPRRAVASPASAARPAPTALLIAAALAAAYLIAAPPAADLSAASYRSDLFSRHGFTLWDNGWYGGHHLPGYSLLAPALGALLGPRLLLALSTVAAAGLFAMVARRAFGERAALAAAGWFALGAGVAMLSGRVAYTLGLAVGLGSLLAAVRGRAALAAALAVACALASPVAAAFLALAAAALAATTARRADRTAAPPRATWAALALCALAPIALLSLAFPEGGYEPFAPSAFWPALAGVIAVALLVGRAHPAVRAGAGLYALALTGSYVLRTPVGGNAARLGALVAGPLVAGALLGRRTRVLAVAAPVLLYWQLVTPIRDLTLVAGDPSVSASYYAPLVDELARLQRGRPARVEVPLTGTHAESDQLARHVALARGWERQLDTRYDGLFYRATLDAGAYRAWLLDNAVAFVALPDVRLDHAGLAEGRLVARGLPFLRPVWRSTHWRLYAVTGARPLVGAPGQLTALGSDGFTLSVPRAGRYTVRVHFTPYWALTAGRGCVARDGDWTAVSSRGPGTVTVAIAFAVGRIFDHDPRCR